jgi:hypothetical protein
MEYRGVKIELSERIGTQVLVSNDYQSPVEYTVTRKSGFIFAAKCKYGLSFAINASDALEGAKKLIDQKVR